MKFLFLFLCILGASEALASICDRVADPRRVHSLLTRRDAPATPPSVSHRHDLRLSLLSTTHVFDNATYPVSVKYFSNCGGEEEMETTTCLGSLLGAREEKEVELRVEVEVVECPASGEVEQVVSIGGREGEVASIHLDFLCQCLCEKDGDPGCPTTDGKEKRGRRDVQDERKRSREERRRERERNMSDSERDAWRNERRERRKERKRNKMRETESSLDGRNVTGSEWDRCLHVDDTQCKETPSSSVCSGRGTCVCGECICDQREDPLEFAYRQFCECTNFLCDRFNGEMCGGPYRGRCECNTCECKKGWKGDACECQDEYFSCLNPYTYELCSGNGICECNECKCFESEEGIYSGKYCDECPTCPSKCTRYRACVECQVFRQGIYTERECATQCTEFNATLVQSVSIDDPSERMCSFFDQNDCRFKFVYGTDAFGQRTMRVESTLECPPPDAVAPTVCEDAQDACVNPETGRVCSGHGTCKCNECKCAATFHGRYYGKWCDDCSTCPTKCGQYRACVECQVFKQGELTEEECATRCTQFNATVVQSVALEDETDKLCIFFDENDCRYKFVYGTDAFGQRTVRVEGPRQCPPPQTDAVAPTVCDDAQDECVNPETGEVCSGQGMCKCNECKCYETDEFRYYGKWCEECPVCPRKCTQYRTCVECQVFRQGELTEEECLTQCTEFNATVVQSVDPKEDTETLCTFFDQTDCRFTFVYGIDSFGQRTVRVEGTRECPPPITDAFAPIVCDDAQDACVNPETGQVCSGQGMCKCNECKCHETEEGRYSGKWCEDCPTCRSKCTQYRACVECQVFRQGELTEEECATQCTQFNATVVQLVAPEDPSERLCSFFDENDCRFNFVYGTDAFGQHTVRVASTLECPPPITDAEWDRCMYDDGMQCKATPSSSVCSGRGTCVCGECECYQRVNPSEMIFGRFCECSNFQCDRFHGQLCGGPDRGECECDRCHCKPGWTGTACECEDSQDECLNPETGKVCSGNGICECNECKCHETEEGRFSGKWCEDCPTCSGRCWEYRACVECQVFQKGVLTEEECATQCTQFNATVVQLVAPEDPSERLCTFFDEHDCRFNFVYGTDAFGQLAVRVQRTFACPPPRGPIPTGRKRERKNRNKMREERKRGREREDQERESERMARRRERKERRNERKRNKIRGRDDVTTVSPSAPDGLTVAGPEWDQCQHADDTHCMETPSSSVCSGRGTCVCGECMCDRRDNPSEMIFGRFCECSNFQCDRFHGQLCGGPDRGECACDRCHCKPGWTGDSCECEDAQDECLNPETGEVCSGNGDCVCNQCKCYESEEGRYSGKWCEDCPTCRSKCPRYRPCVECQAFRQGELTEEECFTQCTEFNVTMVDSLFPDETHRLCTFFDHDGCRFSFTYGIDEFDGLTVLVKQSLECPPPRRYW